MKKLLLVVGLVVFLLPTFASADEVALRCIVLNFEVECSNKKWSDKKCKKKSNDWIDDAYKEMLKSHAWVLDLNKSKVYYQSYKEWPYDIIFNTSEEVSFIDSRGHEGNVSYTTGKYTYSMTSDDRRFEGFGQGTCEEKSRKQTLDPFEAKQQLCGKLGFPIGSQENGNCVLKIFEIESNLKQKEESSGGQLTEADKLIRQQRLNQSLLLMQQGLNLMNPQPKLSCRNTLTGWACY
jgi:hypothetical protein